MNVRYNVIATALLPPMILYLEIWGRSNQRGEAETNDANRNESEIKNNCWEFGLSTLASNASFLLGEQANFGAISDAG